MKEYVSELFSQIATLDSEVILLVALIAMAIIVWDNFDLLSRKKRKQSGFSLKSTAVSVDGSKSLSMRRYVSQIQGLSGQPDALIIENGFVIPVERKPLARKMRDRHVAQLLVYMRLVEEFEGKRPPYGYLILGSQCRRIKISNSDERQAWLQKQLDEMTAIMEGATPRPAPHPRKCAKCDVRSFCSLYHEKEDAAHPGVEAQLVRLGHKR